MMNPLFNVQITKSSRSYNNPSYPLQSSLKEQFKQYSPHVQLAGEQSAWKVLSSFMDGRGVHYQKHISKPLLSRENCSRLSPHIAWGNVSVRQVYQFVKEHPGFAKNKRAYTSFLTRLQWNCHFIQKFEMECEYETRCINRGYTLSAISNAGRYYGCQYHSHVQPCKTIQRS